MLLVFGMMVIGCDDAPNNENGNNNGSDDPALALNGIWLNYGRLFINNGILCSYIRYYNGNFEWTNSSGILAQKGTYILNNNIISQTTTHFIGTSFDLDNKFYSKIELLSVLQMNEEEFAQAYSWAVNAFNGQTLVFYPNENKYVFEGENGATYIKLLIN